MAVLSDKDIKKALEGGDLKISGLEPESVSVASVDLHLGNEFRVFRHSEVTHVDTREGLAEEFTELIMVPDGKPFTIHPGEFVLGSTKESICLPASLTARLDGKSSLGRLGLVIHSTAGSVDPGFEGVLVLEIANISKVPVKLWPGMAICRLTFEELSSPSESPYNKRKSSRFLGQKGPCMGK